MEKGAENDEHRIVLRRQGLDGNAAHCCPLQSLPELRALRDNHPDLWDRLLLMDMEVNRKVDVQTKFRNDYSLPQIEQRFRDEDRQGRLEFDA